MTTETETDKHALPFLKWAGGKRWFVNRHLDLVTPSFKRYLEPFLGSGAVFFGLKPSRALLGDLNPELIATFSAIKENWKPVRTLLRRYHRLHSKRFYYRMRDSHPRSATARAARFIYLNRTCWNGLYRVNIRGQFNVPKGTKKNVLFDTDNFGRTSLVLKRASLVVSDFETVIRQARRGDLIFADPPYVTSHSNNGFLKYNERLFSWDDQVRLSRCLHEAKEKGVHVVSTNADTPAIRNLYRKDFTIRSLVRSSVIAAGPDKRGTRRELVVTSF